MKWLVFVALIIIGQSIKCQPIFNFESKVNLENFYVHQNMLFWLNNKLTFDNEKNIIIGGSDTTTKKIHLFIKKNSTGQIFNYYIENPYIDSLHTNPLLTNLFCIQDTSKFLLIFNKKFHLYLNLHHDSLTIYKFMIFNSPTFRPYDEYFYYEGLYGISPVTSMKFIDHTYFFKDSLILDKVDSSKKNRIYFHEFFNHEFWDYGLTSYISGSKNRLIIANALKNELININVLTGQIDTIKLPILDFIEINETLFDSIYKIYPGMGAPLRLRYFLANKDKFNIIFKVLLKSENEIWILWQGNDIDPQQLKLDIITFDIDEKRWKTKYHKLIYDFRTIQEDKIVSKQQYPLLFFNNMAYLNNDKLFIIANNRHDFDPLIFPYKKVKEFIKDNSKKNSLKLYEFKIYQN